MFSLFSLIKAFFDVNTLKGIYNNILFRWATILNQYRTNHSDLNIGNISKPSSGAGFTYRLPRPHKLKGILDFNTLERLHTVISCPWTPIVNQY